MREREDTDQRANDLRRRTSAELSDFLRYSEQHNLYGEALIRSYLDTLPLPADPPAVRTVQLDPSSEPPAPQPVGVGHRLHRQAPQGILEDSDESSEDLLASTSTEFEDDPDQWGGTPSPPFLVKHLPMIASLR